MERSLRAARCRVVAAGFGEREGLGRGLWPWLAERLTKNPWFLVVRARKRYDEMVNPASTGQVNPLKQALRMRAGIDRREFVRQSAVMAAALWPWTTSGQQNAKTKLILLGTGGGPRPRTTSSQPAQVILVNDTPYVVDDVRTVDKRGWRRTLTTRVGEATP